MKTMKAVRIHNYGGRDELRYEENAPVPEPREAEILLRVKAAAVNPVDVWVRTGRLAAMLKHELPLVLGWDASGVIEAVGAKIEKFKPGDAVFARPCTAGQGTYAEYAVVAESEIAFKPQTVNHIRAAAVPLAALTAWQALFDAAELAAGQTVLIHGGAGGVGHFAVQMAKNIGARVVATASEEDREFLESLGADEVIDYQKVRFEDVVKETDAVLDTIGGDVQMRSFEVLRKNGILVSIVSPPDENMAEKKSVRAQFLIARSNGDSLAEISEMVDRGTLKPIVETVLPLREARRAHELIEAGHTRGKIVLDTMI